MTETNVELSFGLNLRKSLPWPCMSNLSVKLPGDLVVEVAVAQGNCRDALRSTFLAVKEKKVLNDETEFS